ncbi:MAG: caspase family protein [Microscillaceae bacterium]|jgi:hypothetical protein|nr:caspase family protein [Microscillaceae bacterium]
MQKDWQASRTWVLMIGVLEWQNPQRFKPFAKTGRIDRQIADFFRTAGVPDSQLIYLEDQLADYQSVKQAIAHICQNMQAHDFLFFYYAGHGTFDYKKDVCLVVYDHSEGKELTVRELYQQFSQISLPFQALFTADCCHSGALADLARQYNHRFAAIASVVAENTSTGDWTYSNALLECLNGNYFVNPEQAHLSLHQTAEYIGEAMAVVEAQRAPAFIPQNLANWVLSNPTQPQVIPELGKLALIYRKTQQHLGRIINANPLEYQIRFFSYTNDQTEWHKRTEVLLYQTRKSLPIGTPVEVYYPAKGVKKWYEARIVEDYKHILYYIQYDIDQTYEWVDTDRIRPIWALDSLIDSPVDIT